MSFAIGSRAWIHAAVQAGVLSPHPYKRDRRRIQRRLRRSARYLRRWMHADRSERPGHWPPRSKRRQAKLGLHAWMLSPFDLDNPGDDSALHRRYA